MARFTDRFRASAVTIFLCPGEKHQDALEGIARESQHTYAGAIIVSYRQPASKLNQSLARANIDTARFFFVDVLTSTMRKPEKAANTLFISSPGDLTELGLMLSELLRSRAFPIMIFDSVSAMLIYQENDAVVQFLHNLITKCRVANVRLVFIVSQEEGSIQLMKDLQMFVDDIIEFDPQELLEQPAE